MSYTIPHSRLYQVQVQCYGEAKVEVRTSDAHRAIREARDFMKAGARVALLNEAGVCVATQEQLSGAIRV